MTQVNPRGEDSADAHETADRSDAMFDFFFGSPVSRILVTLGIVLIVAGLLWPVLQRIGLGRLPGDIVVERDSFRFYFPIATSLALSALLTLILWLINR